MSGSPAKMWDLKGSQMIRLQKAIGVWGLKFGEGNSQKDENIKCLVNKGCLATPVHTSFPAEVSPEAP